YLAYQAADAPDPEPGRTTAHGDAAADGRGSPPPAPADARRVPGTRTSRLFRILTGVHGRLRNPRLSRGAVPAPGRPRLWVQSCHPRQLPCARRLCTQRRADSQTFVRRTGDRHRAQAPDEPFGQTAVGLADAHLDLRAGDAACSADARRGPSTTAERCAPAD